jgi:hypothetical protein
VNRRDLDRASVSFARLRELGGFTALVLGADGVVRYRVEHELFDDHESAAIAADRAIAERLNP